MSEFNIQNRAGKGVMGFKINKKTGNIVSMALVSKHDHVVLTTPSKTNRIRVESVQESSRVTAGSYLINVQKDKVIDVAIIKRNENSDSEDFSQEEQFFSAGVDYIVTRKSVNGFTILLNKPAPQDIKFSWIALAVKDPRTVEGAPDGSEQPDEEALPPAEEPSEDLNEENTDNQTDDSNVENSQDGSGGEDTGSVVDETENPVVNEGEGSVTVDPDPVPVNEPSNSGDNASSSETATDGETGSSGAPSDTVNP
jgi:hypothetical protein